MEKKGNRYLFSDFPEISFEQWYKQALKEAGSEDALRSGSYEGIVIEPIYNQVDAILNFPSINIPAGWSYIEEVEIWDEKMANKTAIEALEGGAEGIYFVSRRASIDIEGLLNGIWADNCILVIGCSVDDFSMVNKLFSYFDTTYNSPEKLVGWLKVIDNTTCSNKGICTQNVIAQLKDINAFSEKYENFHLIEISVDEYKNQGIDIIQELAYTLSKGVEITESLRKAGIPVERMFRTVVFSLTVGMNFFFEISKLRVLRLLWTKIAEAYGVKILPEEIKIHCKTSLWNKSIFDKENNIIRNTSEAMAAILGGCNYLSVNNPFYNTTKEGQNRRISRSISHILKDEAFLSRVADASKGAYYVENLSTEIASKSWDAFLNVEKEGGFSRVLEQNKLNEEVIKEKNRKRNDLDLRKSLVIGTNIFPNLKEKTGDTMEVESTQELRATGAIEKLRLQVENLYTIRPTVLIASEGMLDKSLSNLLVNVFQSIGFLVEVKSDAFALMDTEKLEKYFTAIWVLKDLEHFKIEKSRLEIFLKHCPIILTSSANLLTERLPFFLLDKLPLTETLEEILKIVKKKKDGEA
jgi:methylmalonyl-CoA mutase